MLVTIAVRREVPVVYHRNSLGMGVSALAVPKGRSPIMPV